MQAWSPHVSWLPGPCSVDVGHDAVGHTLAVCMPGPAVLLQAVQLVSSLSVHQQHDEVEEVEVGEQVGCPCREQGSVTTPPASQVMGSHTSDSQGVRLPYKDQVHRGPQYSLAVGPAQLPTMPLPRC